MLTVTVRLGVRVPLCRAAGGTGLPYQPPVQVANWVRGLRLGSVPRLPFAAAVGRRLASAPPAFDGPGPCGT